MWSTSRPEKRGRNDVSHNGEELTSFWASNGDQISSLVYRKAWLAGRKSMLGSLPPPQENVTNYEYLEEDWREEEERD